MINKQEIHINVKELEDKMRNMETKKQFRKMHSVEINGKLFPLKQPLVVTTGVSPVDITMLEAYLILEKLGYRINFHE